MTYDHWMHILRPHYEGRKFIVAVDFVPSAAGAVRFLKAQGAQRPLVLAAQRGLSPHQVETDAEVVLIDVDMSDAPDDVFMPFIHRFIDAATDPDEEARRRIDAWDPEGTAQVLAAPFFPASSVAGRPTYGGRPASWADLEDKMAVDELWDAADVARAPSVVAELDIDVLAAAAVELDWGHGTVWVGDNRPGWHGGGEYLRWVRDPGDAAVALEFLRRHCDRVRVMPFLAGVPCGLQGAVVDSTVLAVQPIEMLIFGVEGEPRLQYAGAASVWEPVSEQVGAMRGITRRVGHVLMERFDYRGFFTVDGVLTSVGFLPTELNPRLGAGLLRSLHGFEDLPIAALQRAIVAGERLDYRPRRLEQALLQATGDHPGGSATLQVEGVPDAAMEVHLGASGDQMTTVEASGDAMVTIRWDVGLRGASVTARIGPAGALGDGSVAPLMAEAFGYARRTWPLTMPHVRPIPEML